MDPEERETHQPSEAESKTVPTPNTLRHHDALVGCLLDASFPMDLVAHTLAVTDAYLYGFAIQESSLPLGGEGDLTEISHQVLEQFPAEQYPHFARLIAEHTLQPGCYFGREFTVGLDLIVDGLERLLKEGRRESDSTGAGST
jgi:hypothetical protein